MVIFQDTWNITLCNHYHANYSTCLIIVGDVMCPDLDDIPNGAVMMTGNSVGDTATYTCDMGFELVGVMMVTCQDDGMWDNPPPECTRKLTSQHAPWEGVKEYLFSSLYSHTVS